MSDKTYSVLDVADYVVRYTYENSTPVTNLTLNKILFLIWIDYYRDTGKYLFRHPFSAWLRGPVQLDVYNRYSHYGGMPINPYSGKKDETLSYLAQYIDEYRNLNQDELISLTTKEGGAWDEVWRKESVQGRYDRGFIGFDLMIGRRK